MSRAPSPEVSQIHKGESLWDHCRKGLPQGRNAYASFNSIDSRVGSRVSRPVTAPSPLGSQTPLGLCSAWSVRVKGSSHTVLCEKRAARMVDNMEPEYLKSHLAKLEMFGGVLV